MRVKSWGQPVLEKLGKRLKDVEPQSLCSWIVSEGRGREGRGEERKKKNARR